MTEEEIRKMQEELVKSKEESQKYKEDCERLQKELDNSTEELKSVTKLKDDLFFKIPLIKEIIKEDKPQETTFEEDVAKLLGDK